MNTLSRSLLLGLTLGVMLALTLTACGDEPCGYVAPDGCGDGLTCYQDYCYPACSSSQDCESHSTCTDGACVYSPGE